MQLIHRLSLRRLLAGESGIALPAVLGIMLLLTGLTAGIIATVQADTPLAREGQDRKAAYAAAEAGINAYLFRLAKDPDVWANCTAIGGPAFVNQQWNGTGVDPRAWRNLPGGSQARYTVELIPNSASTACSTSDATGTMLEQGVLRIRATGQMRGVKRSIIAKFRRRTFLDFLYFTDYETLDPAWYSRIVSGAPTVADVTAWAQNKCGYWRAPDNRGNQTYNGNWYDTSNNPHAFSTDCTEINFAPGDRIRGPFHTNDEILVCGHPQFGRTANDSVEVTAPSPGWRTSCSGASPTFTGTYTTNSPKLTMPPTNNALLADTLPAYIFTGAHNIVLGTSTLTVDGTTMAYPSNGLIYVQNGTCGQGYKSYDPYNQPSGCANVRVHGTYGTSLTIASAKDIIIDDDLTRTNDAVLGLIANDFVRVYHPVTYTSSSSCTNNTGTQFNVNIEAAILTLAHSFTVDNYFCGGALGTLTVAGVIAQKYRGPVGQGGTTITNGYIKDYNYDDRLAYRSPPHFLDPVSSSWRLLSENEQVPAR